MERHDIVGDGFLDVWAVLLGDGVQRLGRRVERPATSPRRIWNCRRTSTLGHPESRIYRRTPKWWLLVGEDAKEGKLWTTHGGAAALGLKGGAEEGVMDGKRRQHGERDGEAAW
jgi:hypothetical protein